MLAAKRIDTTSFAEVAEMHNFGASIASGNFASAVSQQYSGICFGSAALIRFMEFRVTYDPHLAHYAIVFTSRLNPHLLSIVITRASDF